MSNIQIKIAANVSEMKDVHSIRSVVFTKEQNIPAELDIDGKDQKAMNLLVLIADKPIGTGRLYALNSHIGELARIAVIQEYRGSGVAKLIIEKLEVLAKKQGLKELTLWPHERLTDFYIILDFKVIHGQKQVVAGYRLIQMHKILD
jgi:predicted GNAT family N-acyltransferase